MNIYTLNLDDDFQQIFTRGGSPVVECSCGREHVCINSPAFNEDKESQQIAKEYKKRAKTDKNLILEHEYDCICIVKVNGLIFAEDCECKGWEPYLKFILKERVYIKNFLIRIAEKAQIVLDHEKTFNILKKQEFDILDDPPF